MSEDHPEETTLRLVVICATGILLSIVFRGASCVESSSEGWRAQERQQQVNYCVSGKASKSVDECRRAAGVTP